MAIMITGGTGFVGAHLARRLLQAGETVILFDAQPDLHAIHDIAERVTVIRGDTTVLQDLLYAIKSHGVERMVHLAYMVGPENDQNPRRALHINCVGTNNVFEAARLEGLRRVVWASSVAVYGPRSYYGKVDLDEDDPPQPARVYGACKLFDEHMAESYFRTFQIEHLALRPSIVYGPGRLRGGAQYMQEWIEHAAVGGRVTIPAGDEQETWVYVEDVAEAFSVAVRVAKLPEQHIFNIGGDFQARRALAAYLTALVPDADITVTDDVPDGGSRSANHLNSRIAGALDFRPQWSLERGVRSTVNWVRQRAGLAPVVEGA